MYLLTPPLWFWLQVALFWPPWTSHIYNSLHDTAYFYALVQSANVLEILSTWSFLKVRFIHIAGIVEALIPCKSAGKSVCAHALLYVAHVHTGSTQN